MGLLKSSNDPTVLAVAVHDVGQYVKHYEQGKKYVRWLSSLLTPYSSLFFIVFLRIVTALGAKTRVMELMTHENSDVRYRALVSVQQLLSHTWQV